MGDKDEGVILFLLERVDAKVWGELFPCTCCESSLRSVQSFIAPPNVVLSVLNVDDKDEGVVLFLLDRV